MWRRAFPVMQEAGGEGAGGGGAGAAPGSGGGAGALPGSGSGPGVGTPWYSGLAPEGTELPPLVTEAPDFATFVKNASELKSYVGQSLRIPGPDAGDDVKKEFLQKLTEKVPGVYYMPDPEDTEARKALFRSLGAPDDPNEYTLAPPEAGDLDENMTAQFRQWCAELDLTKDQAAKLYEKYNGYQTAAITQLREGQQQGLQQLKAEWGVTYPDRVKKIDFLLSKYDGTENMRATLANDEAPPHVVKMFYQMAESVLGEGMQMIGAPQAPEGLPPAEAAERAAEIRNNPAFTDEGHPEHARLVAEHFRYMKLANPQSSQEPPARAGFG